MSDAIAVANKLIDAYNRKDFDALEQIFDPNVHCEHHNRGVNFEGGAQMVAIMRQFGEIVPDRRFHSMRRQFAAGDTVVTEIIWEATPVADVPGFAQKGEKIRLELCCVWTVKNGKVVDYHDYG